MSPLRPDDAVPPHDTTPPDGAVSLWERYGWLYSGIWLVFLGYPLAATIQADAPGWQRTLTVALVVGFCAVYLRGFRLQTLLAPEAVRPMVWRALGMLALLAAATAPTIGVEALGFVPFLCSFGIFGLSLRAGAGLAVASAALVVLVAALTEWWVAFYLLPVGLVSLALAITRVFSDTERATVELRLQNRLAADRDRVARDVHDVLGHSLTVVSIKAELAGRLVDDDPERAKAELADIQRLTRTALSEIRATVGGLRATRLTDELDSARDALSAAGIELTAPGDADQVEPRARIALAWVLREAVTNVVRHSGARHVEVRWGSTWLEVVDDGCGRRTGREGNGLSGLRERVTALGGRLEIGDGPGGVGTLVRVEQP